MSRKHFIALARALANNRPEKKSRARYQQWERDCSAVASVCSEHNDYFDWNKFINACETW